jgi:purine-nucleoside phosphorylase
MIESIENAASFLSARGFGDPQTGIILGTGLGAGFVHEMSNPLTLDYQEIPGFPLSTVESHHGRLLAGEVHGRKVIAMQGRFHYYEGYSLQQVTFPVRVLGVLGIRQLLISNAAGNLNRAWNKGELMLLDDHINLLPDNPLRGINHDKLGPRFPDMSSPYSPELNKLLIEIAGESGITLRKGVYAAVPGPNLETRAEYRFLRTIGADAVGMSTVPEVIVCNHMQIPCCAVSVMTDDCDPDNLAPANIAEIIRIAGQSEAKLTRMFVALIGRIGHL